MCSREKVKVCVVDDVAKCESVRVTGWWFWGTSCSYTLSCCYGNTTQIVLSFRPVFVSKYTSYGTGRELQLHVEVARKDHELLARLP
jgi:hypothetical protein